VAAPERSLGTEEGAHVAMFGVVEREFSWYCLVSGNYWEPEIGQHI